MRTGRTKGCVAAALLLPLVIVAQDISGREKAEEGARLEEQVKLYPNPTTGTVYLEVALREPADLHVRIYNLLGKTVAERKEPDTKGGKYRIDLDGQLNGVYFAEVQAGNGAVLRRVRLAR